MKIFTNALISLSLLLPLSGYAQSTVKLNGTVVDGQTGDPIIRVNITVDGTGYGASTDQFGHFEVENMLEGTYTITADHIGYLTQKKYDIYLPKDQPVRIKFTLIPKILISREIIVQADRYTSGLQHNTYQIEAAEIKRSNAQTVAELLETIPGLLIMATDGNSGTGKISIRGSHSNQVLILLDDIPLNNGVNGDADLSSIPANIVDRVEIIKGGASQKYGSGAIGGVVSITTKQAVHNEIRMNTGYGSFHSYWINPSLSGKSNSHYGNLGVTASYHYQQTNDNFPYVYTDSNGITMRDERRNAESTNRNGYARFNYSLQNHRFALNIHRLISDRGIPGKIDAWTPYAHTHMRHSIYGMSYEFFKKDVRFTLNSQHLRSETENKNLYSPDIELKYRRVPQYDYQYMTATNIINTKVDYQLSESWNAELSYNGRMTTFEDENFLSSFGASIDHASDRSHGVYMHHDYKEELKKLHSRLHLTFDIRYDHMMMRHQTDHRVDDQWSPGMVANISTGEKIDWFAQLSLSRSFRIPTFADLFYQDTRVQGKPDLLPEKAVNKEVIIGFKSSQQSTLSADVHFFSQKIDDLIVWRLGSFEVFRPFNTNAAITGEEYNIQFSSAADFVKIDVYYTHIRALNKDDNLTTYNKIIPYRPIKTMNARFESNYQGASWRIDYRHVGKRYVTEANTKSMPSYDVLDSSLMYSFKSFRTDVTVKLSVQNIADEIYQIVRDMPLPGREWRFGVDIVF